MHVYTFLVSEWGGGEYHLGKDVDGGYDHVA